MVMDASYHRAFGTFFPRLKPMELVSTLLGVDLARAFALHWIGLHQRTMFQSLGLMPERLALPDQCWLYRTDERTGARVIGVVVKLVAQVLWTCLTPRWCTWNGKDCSYTRLYSTEVKKTEVLAEAFRRAIKLTPTEAENPLGGYGKVVSHVVVGLKTVSGTKRVRDHAMYWPIRRICIILRLESETYIPLPKGDVQNVALGDLGAASARPQDDQDIMNVMGSQCGRSKITEICEEVSEAVKGYVNQGVA
ncbi:hypothetical protein BKA82DRAFT_9440 [Pisolithus tinctorius]|uniref:RuvB-like helicase n=1 Tax=Pisolithus tinctorius Marx 270 TaxID=870435 RepID=A0A0C3K317_PISTI|nr:hypothetical protein BKA82DRAFT_4019317 [Pisolithus tinctorius]KAI6144625.1 hypothetical protein BKA82DRAFT_9440 [Pisolithus tinctorius]KIO03887.1 hypothetical protein M404DRAFT_9440 [Pisolithus tinctorius Marx 270]